MRRLNEINVVLFFILLIAIISTLIYPHLSTNGGDETASMAKLKQMRKSQEMFRFLRKIARDDNLLLITSLSKEWMPSSSSPDSFLDLFMEAFRLGEETSGLLNHLLVLAMDEEAFQYCKSRPVHCALLTNSSSAAAEGSSTSEGHRHFLNEDDDLTKLIEFLEAVLELGFNFAYSDLDVMWFRQPWRHFPSNNYLILATDSFHGDSSPDNEPNGGLIVAMSSEQSVAFFNLWRVLQKMNAGLDRRSSLSQALRRAEEDPFELAATFLDDAYFGGLCQHGKDLDPREVCIMQANCCRDMQEKFEGLWGFLQDWRNYTALSVEDRREGKAYWNIFNRCTR
ncbi:hypothetical protein Cni_G24931 [Canna indica]|uniref:Nucleotide-diphospho-sugar transferase domain-containing protein n=1 Tax=Canna indica TaxID=4628 RepID=A0AAQ3KWN5_9LILI|nr:hypothetical protein Cni_G24931 [Canna indica]